MLPGPLDKRRRGRVDLTLLWQPHAIDGRGDHRADRAAKVRSAAVKRSPHR